MKKLFTPSESRRVLKLKPIQIRAARIIRVLASHAAAMRYVEAAEGLNQDARLTRKEKRV